MQFLSAEWLHAADVAVRAVTVDPTTSIVIEQRVTEAPEGTVVYSLVARDGACRVVVDDRPPPDVTISMPWPLARAIAEGTEGAQLAFLHGRIRIGGDSSALVRHSTLAGAVAEALASIA